MVESLNRRKGRERIMPFGGTILAEDMARLFSGVSQTPYMQFVLRASDGCRRTLPAIVHVDGSSRLQSVDRSTGSAWLYRMLRELARLTGTAAVLNTSLNGPGEPIVERPEEAVRLAQSGVVDCLVVGDALIARRDLPSEPRLLDALEAATASDRR